MTPPRPTNLQEQKQHFALKCPKTIKINELCSVLGAYGASFQVAHLALKIIMLVMHCKYNVSTVLPLCSPLTSLFYRRS